MNQQTIIYDDDCGFCDWCRDLVEKYDHNNQFVFVGIRTPEALEIAQEAGQTINPQDPESFILYNQAKDLWLDKSQAAREITRHVSGPLHIFFYILSVTPRFLSDWGYKRIANNRRYLGPLVGRKTCRIRP